jgi:hypothetical protein
MPGLDAPADAADAPLRDVHVPYGDGIVVRAGHGSVAVPGALAALELAWRRHGSLPWKEIVAPAAALARRGFPLGWTTARWLEIAGRLLFTDQDASRRCFFPDGDEPPAAGTAFTIPDMGDTLDLIAREGARALYEGDLAAALVEELSTHGTTMTRADLEAYEAAARPALVMRSRGHALALNPPPAVGGVALGVLIGLLDAGWDPDATLDRRALLQARAQEHVLLARKDELLPPTLDRNLAAALLSTDGLRERAAALRSPHTTHLSVATGAGDVVAVTMSNGYGAGVTIPGTGIACNNSLGEPELNPLGYHGMPPGSRLVSNMAPTIADRDDGRRIALGVLIGLLDAGWDPDATLDRRARPGRGSCSRGTTSPRPSPPPGCTWRSIPTGCGSSASPASTRRGSRPSTPYAHSVNSTCSSGRCRRRWSRRTGRSTRWPTFAGRAPSAGSPDWRDRPPPAILAARHAEHRQRLRPLSVRPAPEPHGEGCRVRRQGARDLRGLRGR